jgi:hypothetical protein
MVIIWYHAYMRPPTVWLDRLANHVPGQTCYIGEENCYAGSVRGAMSGLHFGRAACVSARVSCGLEAGSMEAKSEIASGKSLQISLSVKTSYLRTEREGQGGSLSEAPGLAGPRCHGPFVLASLHTCSSREWKPAPITSRKSRSAKKGACIYTEKLNFYQFLSSPNLVCATTICAQIGSASERAHYQ